MAKKTPFFSIIIPVLNEEKVLPFLLRDLSRQTLKDFEVVISNGKSKDKTAQIALDFQKHLNLTLHQCTKNNVSIQRNAGAAAAHGKWLIFMDADNRLPIFFLEGLKYRIAQESRLDLFTTWIKVDGHNAMYSAIERSINMAIELYRIIGKPTAIGACIGCRKEVMATIQFDPKQKYIEDGIFVNEACDKGFIFKVFRDPKFTYSLRRLRRDGIIKMASTVALMQLKYIQDKNFYNDDRYPMLGGTYYEEGIKQLPAFNRLNSFIRNASEKQLTQAKHLVSIIKEW
jgi:glycosyltransferase involved in cell wall biosynthesis